MLPRIWVPMLSTWSNNYTSSLSNCVVLQKSKIMITFSIMVTKQRSVFLLPLWKPSGLLQWGWTFRTICCYPVVLWYIKECRTLLHRRQMFFWTWIRVITKASPLFSPSLSLEGSGTNSPPGRFCSEVPFPSCLYGGGEHFFVLGKVEKGKEWKTQGTGPDNTENADIN